MIEPRSPGGRRHVGDRMMSGLSLNRANLALMTHFDHRPSSFAAMHRNGLRGIGAYEKLIRLGEADNVVFGAMVAAKRTKRRRNSRGH